MIAKNILLLIGLMFSNPVFPDFGLQLITSLAIGLLLPAGLINAINKMILKIPIVKWLNKKLKKDILKNHKTLKNLIPRIFAGYIFTYAIGFLCLALAYLS